MLIVATFVFVKKFCKNVLPIRNAEKSAFCPNSAVKTHSHADRWLHMFCTAVDAVKTWWPFSVLALQSRREAAIANIDAKLFVFRPCIFVLSTSATCCDEEVSASLTRLRNSFVMSEKVLNFSSSPFCLKDLKEPCQQTASEVRAQKDIRRHGFAKR